MDALVLKVREEGRVIRIFPSREPVARLIGALLMELDDKWSTGKRYLDRIEYLQWKEKRQQVFPRKSIKPAISL